MIEYQVTEQSHTVPGAGPCKVYGIRAVASPDSQTAVCAAPDVFCRREQAAELCARLNRLMLDPIHLPDVIEDALSCL